MGAELVLGQSLVRIGGAISTGALTGDVLDGPVVGTGLVLGAGAGLGYGLGTELRNLSIPFTNQTVGSTVDFAVGSIFGSSDTSVPQPMTAAEQQAYRQQLPNQGSASPLPSVGSPYVPTTASPTYNSPMPAVMTAEQRQQQFEAQQLAQTQQTLNQASTEAKQWATNFKLAGLQATVVPFSPPQAGQYPFDVAQAALQSATQQAFTANQAAQQNGDSTRTIAFTRLTDTGLDVPMLVTGTPQQLAQWLNPLRQNADGSYATPILSATDFANSGVSTEGLNEYYPTGSQVAGLPALPNGSQPSEFMDAATRLNDVAFMLEQNVAHNQRNANSPKLLLQLPSGKAFSVDGLNQEQLVAYLQQVVSSGVMTQAQLATNLEQNGLGGLASQVFASHIANGTIAPDVQSHPELESNAVHNIPDVIPQIPTHTGHTLIGELPSLEGFDTTAPTATPLGDTSILNVRRDLSIPFFEARRLNTDRTNERLEEFEAIYGIDDEHSIVSHDIRAHAMPEPMNPPTAIGELRGVIFEHISRQYEIDGTIAPLAEVMESYERVVNVVRGVMTEPWPSMQDIEQWYNEASQQVPTWFQ